MAYDPTDAVTARRLLERAVEMNTVPVLTAAEIDDLMEIAADDDDGTTVYTAQHLNDAAATGWQLKMNKVSSDFTVTLEDGVKFNREQVLDRCERIRDAYLSGRASVIGRPRRRGSIISIPLVTDIGEVS